VTMTIDDLRKILVACAGAADGAALDGDIRDVDFDELGYDSLALMETAARIKSDFGVTIPDERIAELRTPGEILDLVNTSAAAAG
jgi:act minimal PKS acyl carrier protein